MRSEFNFTVTSWFLRKVRIKPSFNTQWPPPSLFCLLPKVNTKWKDWFKFLLPELFVVADNCFKIQCDPTSCDVTFKISQNTSGFHKDWKSKDILWKYLENIQKEILWELQCDFKKAVTPLCKRRTPTKRKSRLDFLQS